MIEFPAIVSIHEKYLVFTYEAFDTYYKIEVPKTDANKDLKDGEIIFVSLGIAQIKYMN